MVDPAAPPMSLTEDEYLHLFERTMGQFRPLRDDKVSRVLALLEIVRNQAAELSIEVTRSKALPQDFFLIDVITFALRDLRKIVGDQQRKPVSALTR